MAAHRFRSSNKTQLKMLVLNFYLPQIYISVFAGAQNKTPGQEALNRGKDGDALGLLLQRIKFGRSLGICKLECSGAQYSKQIAAAYAWCAAEAVLHISRLRGPGTSE
jgi:hypothetical protein